MLKLIPIFFLVLFISLLLNCTNENLVGGPCAYDTIPGKAFITSIDTSTHVNNVSIQYDFISNDASYNESNLIFCLSSKSASNFSSIVNLIETNDSLFACDRLEIISGTCSPTGYSFDGYFQPSDTSWKISTCL